LPNNGLIFYSFFEVRSRMKTPRPPGLGSNEGMNLESSLIDGFAYERWATSRWIRAYRDLPEPSRFEPILDHICWALETWLVRVQPSFDRSETVLLRRLEIASAAWIELLPMRSLDESIAYRNTSGKPFKVKIGAIVAGFAKSPMSKAFSTSPKPICSSIIWRSASTVSSARKQRGNLVSAKYAILVCKPLWWSSQC
jgi:hypothetical protein